MTLSPFNGAGSLVLVRCAVEKAGVPGKRWCMAGGTSYDGVIQSNDVGRGPKNADLID